MNEEQMKNPSSSFGEIYIVFMSNKNQIMIQNADFIVT